MLSLSEFSILLHILFIKTNNAHPFAIINNWIITAAVILLLVVTIHMQLASTYHIQFITSCLEYLTTHSMKAHEFSLIYHSNVLGMRIQTGCHHHLPISLCHLGERCLIVGFFILMHGRISFFFYSFWVCVGLDPRFHNLNTLILIVNE